MKSAKNKATFNVLSRDKIAISVGNNNKKAGSNRNLKLTRFYG
jgi:hypothetical protein